MICEYDLSHRRTILKALFQAKGITEYDFNTVAQIPYRLLHITPTLEDSYRVR